MNKIEERIEQLKTDHRLQVETAMHYYWNRNDDVLGNQWQEIANNTQAEINQLEKERDIIEKWN